VFELESRRRSIPTINLSALIDIAFILVIFIVLGAPFQRVHVIDVDLPSADADADPDHEGLVVTVPVQGPVRFGTREVQDADLPAALRDARGHHDSILLLADRATAVQRAVDILAEAQKYGFKTVAIATQRAK
jgi:biopolymer transport protein ExbD